MTVLERLRDKANSLPVCPGVYIMKDADGRIIYVGKSKKLKNRVTSYFIGSSHSPKTDKMVSLVRDFDYIVCNTEIESLALENVLIKRHSPKYNIRLKDAKSYPYVKITGEEYPRILVTRERKGDKAKYFGPYSGTAAAYAALSAVVKVFRLPTCKRSFPKDIGKERPCIYKDMGRCSAPCDSSISRERYVELIKGAERVLSGNSREAELILQRDMEEAAENLEFERAAALRDSMLALKQLTEKQKIVADMKVSRDVFAFYSDGAGSALAMLIIRSGALIGKNEFLLSGSENADSEELVSLIASHYDEWGDPPREIVLDLSIDDEDASLLSEYLSLGRKYKVNVRRSERGEGRALCDMARDNARESVRQHILEGEREDKTIKRLTELLSLPESPRRIEAYDISNIGNENIVGSMVVWQSGKLKRGDYRAFNVRTTSGADDYGSMREVLTRRLSHIGDGSASLGDTPSLILVDGGLGHVGVAKEVLSELGEEIAVFGMVKDDFHKTRALIDENGEISIAKEFNVYGFIYNLQEEAHRFAIKTSQKAKTKTLTHSSLEKIENIGPGKARALLSAMPLGKIREANVEELMKVRGIGEADAKRIVEYYRSRGKLRNKSE
ncbi:MAG: excinuclease ABC subunit UvrC [Clostridia bacterium]|nr:excinuclease ABC subunit UvrC [Clostridia bacterium]